MKKKIVILAAVAALLSIVGFGTYAALNASATASNIVTAGSVDISLRDERLAGENAWEAFPEGALDVLPDTTVTKRVYVTNTGKNDCYVRLKLVPEIKAAEGKAVDVSDITIKVEDEHWVADGEGFYRYDGILKPEETTEFPMPCEIYFDGAKMGMEYLGATIDVVNHAQAVQAENNGAETILEVKGWPSAEPVEPEPVEPEPEPEPQPEPIEPDAPTE